MNATPEPAAMDSAERDALCHILLRGLKKLADAGDAETACRLAGEACALLRHHDMKQWKRFNGLLHGISRGTAPVGD